jgi:enamine deaminase RidA (YjgF/YER057c/UK114 family)
MAMRGWWIPLVLAGLCLQPIAMQAAEPSAPIRYPIPNGNFPIALAVEIPPGHSLVYVSGQVPTLVNPEADRSSVAAWGDTRVQSTNVLVRIEEILRDLRLGMDDVVKMQVFLVGDPALEGRMDFRGFMQAYVEFFGTEAQPNLPARSVMQVAGLANPGWLVEIEVVAVRPPGEPRPAAPLTQPQAGGDDAM